MIVKKSLNNNVVLVDENDNDVILIGSGVGFGVKNGDVFCNFKNIQQKFVLEDSASLNRYESVLKECNDEKIITLVENTLSRIKKENTYINENIHITLLDHVCFAIERDKKELMFNNEFNNDIKFLYEKEYNYAEELIDNINKECGTSLNNSEVGICALHIHSALNNEKLEDVRLKQLLIDSIITAISKELNIKPNIKSLSYQRMLVHVRFAVYRVLSNKQLDDSLDNFIKTKYKKLYKQIKEAVIPVAEKYSVSISDSEICYLVIHFKRIEKEEKKNG